MITKITRKFVWDFLLGIVRKLCGNFFCFARKSLDFKKVFNCQSPSWIFIEIWKGLPDLGVWPHSLGGNIGWWLMSKLSGGKSVFNNFLLISSNSRGYENLIAWFRIIPRLNWKIMMSLKFMTQISIHNQKAVCKSRNQESHNKM